ncbi:MAG: hypothetical protein LBL15_03940, partial [Oscillospiraceae bacterium]|nr:hypothetical protein [Oscillospiraceae bacterium]
EEGLVLPETVDGNIYLSAYKSTDGLTLPKKIGEDLFLFGIESIARLKKPEIGGKIHLKNGT